MRSNLLKAIQVLIILLLVSFITYHSYHGLEMAHAIISTSLCALVGGVYYLSDRGYKDSTEEAINHTYKEFSEVLRKRDEAMNKELAVINSRIEKQEMTTSFKQTQRPKASF